MVLNFEYMFFNIIQTQEKMTVLASFKNRYSKKQMMGGGGGGNVQRVSQTVLASFKK